MSNTTAAAIGTHAMSTPTTLSTEASHLASFF